VPQAKLNLRILDVNKRAIITISSFTAASNRSPLSFHLPSSSS